MALNIFAIENDQYVLLNGQA